MSKTRRRKGAQSKKLVRSAQEQTDSDQDKKLSQRQYGTIGYLMQKKVEAAISEGTTRRVDVDRNAIFESQLNNLLNEHLGGHDLPFSITKFREAPIGIRTDKPSDIQISYRIFNPPGYWGIHHYSILRCAVKQRYAGPPAKFMSHFGEELLYTEQEGLKYCFFNPKPKSSDIELPVHAGKIARIRPEFPHNNFYTKDEVDCWMILRPLSGTYMTETYPAPVAETDKAGVSPGKSRPKEASGSSTEDSRLFAERKDLKGFTGYAMLALGLRDKIRVARLQSGLSISELAQLTSLNSSYLGRLEAGKANISLDNLARLARLLGVDLANLGEQLRAKPFFESHPQMREYLHLLHPRIWQMGKGQKLNIRFPQEPLMNNSSSWIVAQGEVTFSYTQSRNQRPDKAVVGQDDVLHLRGLWQDDHMASFETMADARLLEIRYSCHCTCDQQVHDLTTE